MVLEIYKKMEKKYNKGRICFYFAQVSMLLGLAMLWINPIREVIYIFSLSLIAYSLNVYFFDTLIGELDKIKRK